jgi:hypothetical protein
MNYLRSLRNLSPAFLAAGFSILLTACGGSLSDEQRKKMREEMELHEIKRVTEPEITEAAFEKGRTIMTALEGIKNDRASVDSLAATTKTRIRWITPSKTDAEKVEQQLIEAYIAGAETGSLQDNIQKIKATDGTTDSLLYTKPLVKNLPDGAVQVKGTWNITFSQKELILSMTKKKK